MMTLTHSVQSNIITFHDAITDSPIYRASTLHFDHQLDKFSQWIEDLGRQMKTYADKLKELNVETVSLVNKLIPTAIVDDYLLDSNITDIAATKFGEALKANLTFKIKMVSDLEDNFAHPIQLFANNHIRHFKTFRTQHKQALADYENVLATYHTFSITGNPDATTHSRLTQQLNSARQKYVEMSSEHVLRIIKLRHELEHCLVERFSATTLSRKDVYSDAQIWKQLDSMLFSWTKWLAQDKRTARLELQKHESTKRTLEKEYLKSLQVSANLKPKSTSPTNKSGYLFTKSKDDTSAPWKRQWFFVHDDYFGCCSVTDTDKTVKIIVDDCVPLQSCALRHTETSHHRFCFELVSRHDSYRSLFLLQADSQQDMEDWLAAIRSKTIQSVSPHIKTPLKTRPSSIIIGSYDSNNDLSQPRSPALLIAKSKSTTVVSTPTDIPVTISMDSSGFSNLSNLSSSPGETINSALSVSHSATTSSAPATSLMITCTSSEKHDDIRLSAAPSAISSMLYLITDELSPREPFDTIPDDYDPLVSKLWGTPRSNTPPLPHKKAQTFGEGCKNMRGRTVWPIQYENAYYSTPDIPSYTSYLNDKNQELRQLFNGVSREEVVMDVFSASFVKKQDSIKTLGKLRTSSSSIYHYGGSAYATQTALWFYSNLSSNCITSVALKWEDVEDVQVGEDSEVTINLVDGNRGISPLVFSLILFDDAEIVAQKLRFLVYNAKLTDPMQLRNIYRKLVAMAVSPPSLSSSSSTSSASSASSYTQQNSTETTSYTSATLCTKDIPPRLSSRMISTETTSTVDTMETLASQTSGSTSSHSPAHSTSQSLEKPSIVDPDALPAHIRKPVEPIPCQCDDHLDRCHSEMELPISAKRLFHLMFSDEVTGPPTDGGVWNSKTNGINGRDLRVTLWEPLSPSESGHAKRTLKYWMPVANPVVRLKEAEVAETQIILKKDDYLCYVVQISTKTEALPFADAFVPSVRYCITYVDDSRCKLSCYLGVKWLKWVMAKIIITKAAFSGMSDSISIFVPILEEAACAVQKTVGNMQQLGIDDSAESRPACANNTDGGESGINTGLDGGVITTAATLDPTSNHGSSTMAEESPLLGNKLHQDNHTIGTNLSPSVRPETPTRSIMSSFALVTTLQGQVAHIRRSIKTAASSHRIATLMKSTFTTAGPLYLWVVCVIMLLVSLLVATMIPSSFSTFDQSQVVSHAVYLRDLDEGFLAKSMQPPYSGSKSYDRFIKTRKDQQEYTWYEGRHYRLAQKYRASREHLGVLRHNMLNIFQALNIEDSSLLENEYLNWLLDNRQRCRMDRKLIQQQALEYNDTSSYLCDQVSHQIGTYF